MQALALATAFCGNAQASCAGTSDIINGTAET